MYTTFLMYYHLKKKRLTDLLGFKLVVALTTSKCVFFMKFPWEWCRRWLSRFKVVITFLDEMLWLFSGTFLIEETVACVLNELSSLMGSISLLIKVKFRLVSELAKLMLVELAPVDGVFVGKEEISWGSALESIVESGWIKLSFSLEWFATLEVWVCCCCFSFEFNWKPVWIAIFKNKMNYFYQ